MKKALIIFIILTLLFSSTVNATSIYLTSDNINNYQDDRQLLEDIKNYIQEYSNNSIDVIIDPNAPSPGEGTRLIESHADSKVTLSAVCAGNLLILARASADTNDNIILVNMGNFDISGNDYVRRAWDDNYSPSNFAGINNPSKFLEQAGIQYIQPLKELSLDSYTSNEDEVSKLIAKSVINSIGNDTNNKIYDSSQIVTHNIPVSYMSDNSREYLENNQSTITSSQLLYLTSMYLNGNGLTYPDNYSNLDNPLEYSFFTRNQYTYYDYVNMAHNIKDYMDNNHKAPDYIYYNGAIIGYNDLVYNFAKITQSHTYKDTMNFNNTYAFEKTNDSIIINNLPIILIIIAITLLAITIKRKH